MATYALLFVNDESFRERPKDEVAAIYAEALSATPAGNRLAERVGVMAR